MWESEESRKIRPEFRPQYQGQMPSWLGNQVGQAIEIGRGGAEESRATARRATDALAQGAIASGEAVGQGLRDIGGKLSQWSQENIANRRAEEQLALQRAADTRAQDAHRTTQERAAMENAALPAQLQSSAAQAGATLEATKAATEQTRQATAEQQFKIDSLRRNNEFQLQPAVQLGLPDARPGETVEQYELRQSHVKNAENLEKVKLERQRMLMENKDFASMAPARQQQMMQNLELTGQQIAGQKLQNTSQQLANRQSQQAFNVNTLKGILMPYSNNPAAMNAKADELVRQNGVLPGEIGQAMGEVISSVQSQAAQRAMYEQMSPQYRVKVDAFNRAAAYNRAIAVLSQYEKQLGGVISLGGAQESQAVESIAEALVGLGKNELAVDVRDAWTLQAGLPTGRKSLVSQILQNLKKEFEAEVNANGGMHDVPAIGSTWSNLQQTTFANQMSGGMSQQKQNPFGNLGGMDFSALGGAK